MRGADATVVVDTAEAQVDPAEALEEIEAIAEEVIAPEGSRFLVVGGSQVSVKDGAAADDEEEDWWFDEDNGWFDEDYPLENQFDQFHRMAKGGKGAKGSKSGGKGGKGAKCSKG